MTNQLVFYRTKSLFRISPDIGRGIFFAEFAKAKTGQEGKPEKGVEKYDYENKVVFALSIYEALHLSEILMRICKKEIYPPLKNDRADYYHDPSKGNYKSSTPKTMTVTYMEDSGIRKKFLGITVGKAQEPEQKIAVILSDADCYAIAQMIPHGVATILRWTDYAEYRVAAKDDIDPDTGEVKEPGDAGGLSFDDLENEAGEDVPF